MNENKIPTWAIYVISGLSVVIVAQFGLIGKLISSDRTNIDSAFNEIKKAIIDHKLQFDQIVVRQNEQITEISKHNERQNHIMDKMCWLMTLSYPERMKLFDKYPAIVKPKIEEYGVR